MRSRHFILVFILTPLIIQNTVAQEVNLIGRANIGIGFDYLEQDFNGINTRYSPGGGLGLEAGLEGEIQNNLFWYGTLGMTINLNLHYEEVNGTTRKTSFSWNKKYFTGGINKYFDIRNNHISDFYGGGGLTLGIPGILRLTENGTGNGSSGFKGRINYKTSAGFQLHSGITLTIFDGFLLRPEIRYRYINYNSKQKSPGLVNTPELKKANAQGIDISVSIVKRIKGGRR